MKTLNASWLIDVLVVSHYDLKEHIATKIVIVESDWEMLLKDSLSVHKSVILK